jgi:hypothetical protein
MLRNFFASAFLALALVFPPASASGAIKPTSFSTREPTLNKDVQKLLADALRSAPAGKPGEARRATEAP